MDFELPLPYPGGGVPVGSWPWRTGAQITWGCKPEGSAAWSQPQSLRGSEQSCPRSTCSNQKTKDVWGASTFKDWVERVIEPARS